MRTVSEARVRIPQRSSRVEPVFLSLEIHVNFWLLCTIPLGLFLPSSPPLELRDGDRVVLLGNAFFERELPTSYIETLLTARHPERNLKFRNLGWSGDNVWGHSRTLFDPLERGLARIEEQVKELRATVVLLAYGMNESFDGPAALPRFIEGLGCLADRVAALGARVAIISPIRHEDMGRPLPDPKPHNDSLTRYVEAMSQLAGKRRLPFVNLFKIEPRPGQRLTRNGIQPTAEGYRVYAEEIARQFGHGLEQSVLGTRSGEALRRAIVEKNQLFFHSWRPQNETYILGFRKHEQGQNAVEISRIDPLIEAREKEIETLRSALTSVPPIPHPKSDPPAEVKP